MFCVRFMRNCISIMFKPCTGRGSSASNFALTLAFACAMPMTCDMPSFYPPSLAFHSCSRMFPFIQQIDPRAPFRTTFACLVLFAWLMSSQICFRLCMSMCLHVVFAFAPAPSFTFNYIILHSFMVALGWRVFAWTLINLAILQLS